MTILFPRTDLLAELFPGTAGNEAAMLDAMKAFYTINGVSPRVAVGDGFIEVELDVERIERREKAYQEAVAAYENGHFARGRSLLQVLVKQQPQNSEYHRMLGQVCAELGEPEAAIDHLIDALRWDPTNTHALTMMGNLQAQHRTDMDTAMRYYEAALAAKPDDHFAANNIAAQFLNQGNWAVAETWFKKALAIAPNYPNARHGLAIVREKKGDLSAAFFEATEALRHNTKRDELYRQSLALAQHVATELVALHQGNAVVQQLCAHLHKAGGLAVRSIPVKNTRPAPVKKTWGALACVPLFAGSWGAQGATGYFTG